MLKKVIGVFLFSTCGSGNSDPEPGDLLQPLEWMMGNQTCSLNPQAPEGQQWLLITVDDRAAGDDEVAEFRRQREQKSARMSVTAGETNPLDNVT